VNIAPTPAPLPPVDVPELVEPGPAPGWWEETPAAAARADDRYWDSLYDRDED
jgi:hypothetical protein